MWCQQTEHVVGGGQADQAAQPGDAVQDALDAQLRRAGAEGDRSDRRGGPLTGRLRMRRPAERVHERGHVTQHGTPVEVGDGEAGVLGAQFGGEFGGAQAAAAESEEVAVRVGPDAQQLLPAVGETVGRTVRRGLPPDGPSGPRRRGQRPGQGVAVHLPRGARGQFGHFREHRHQGGGQPVRQYRAGPPGIEARPAVAGERARHDVTDQDVSSRRGGPNGRRRCAYSVQPVQCGVDLPQFDPPAADLHLVVGPADVDQARGLRPYEIARAVGALRAQRGRGAEASGFPGRVQVPRDARSRDHQLPFAAVPDGAPGSVHDGQLPARERQPDAYRASRQHPFRAGHDRRLGRPVRVPHLPARRREPPHELRRARLPARDEQPHPGERLVRPQRGQRRHRGDHRDAPVDEPRAEFVPRPHQPPRCGHQARAVPPGQPHLLARGVEGDGETCQHPVAGAERPVLPAQEQPGLGVDEGRRRTVRHRHSLGTAGRTGREDDPGVVLGPRR